MTFQVTSHKPERWVEEPNTREHIVSFELNGFRDERVKSFFYLILFTPHLPIPTPPHPRGLSSTRYTQDDVLLRQ